MGTRSGRGGLLAALGVVALLLCQPGVAQAHPNLMGRWTAPTPPGTTMAYAFGPGEYLGGGVWRGPLMFFVCNVPISGGEYELRMFNGTQGTLGIADGTQIGWSVGNVDFATRTFTFLGVTYRP